jgi:hypothetical protein
MAAFFKDDRAKVKIELWLWWRYPVCRKKEKERKKERKKERTCFADEFDRMSSFCDQTEDILFIYYTQYATEPLLKTIWIKTFKILKR